jgi:hypothetical protein
MVSADVDLEWQAHVYRELGDLVAGTATEGVLVRDAAGLARAVAGAIEATSLPFVGFARLTGFSVASVSLWASGRRRPSLPALLRISRVSGVAVIDMLATRLAPRATAPKPVPVPHLVRRRIDWATVERELLTALESEPPPSLRSLCRHHGISRREAHRVLPGLAACVAERHVAWRADRNAMRRRESEEVIRATTESIWRSGVHPGKERVAAALPPGQWLREPHQVAAWRKEVRRLNGG